MQKSQVWTSTYREDSGSRVSPGAKHGSPQAKARGSAPQGSSPPSTLRELSLGSKSPKPDIWSPLFHRGSWSSATTSTLRGSSFGAYGALPSLGGTQSTSASPSFDSERFRNGGAAWGSAELPRRRLASFPSAEPGTTGGSPGSTPEREPFLASLNPAPPPSASQKLDFTGPSISVLERFSNLGDATKRAELGATKPADSHTPQASPLPQHSKLWAQPSAKSAQSGSPVPVPVPVPVPIPSGQGTSPSHSAMVGPKLSHTTFIVPGTTGDGAEKMAAYASDPYSNLGAAAVPLSIGTSGTSPVPAAAAARPTSNGSGHRNRRKRVDSPFLEKLRSASSGSMQLADILGNVLEASTDQHGSRFIQERLSTAPASVTHDLLGEVLPDALALATDVFGNYVVQLLFEVCSPEDRVRLWSQMRGHVLSLTLHMYGCRVVQMALRYSDSDTRREIVQELDNNVLRCIRDHNGNHVIQKAIEFVNPEDITAIIDDMLREALPLAKHMYGCRVVQRALEHGSADARSKVLEIIKNNIDTLVLDQYGNYVVQHVVEQGEPEDREFVLDRLISNVVALSSHKYASNVMEKCFIKSSPTQRSEMVTAIVSSTIDGEPAVLSMMKDQYANYVIQRILGTARDDDYNRLARVVKKNLPSVKRSHHGKHLQAIERRLRP